MEMSVIVAVGHAILTHVLEVVPAVGPGIRIQGLGAGEVVHAAGRRSLATPFPRSMVVPVVVESIYVLAVDIIEFICLKVERGRKFHRIPVKGMQVRIELGNPALPITERNPAIAVVVNYGTRIKYGAAAFYNRIVAIDKALAQRRCPRTHRRLRLDNAGAKAAIGEIEGEKRAAIGLFLANEAIIHGATSPTGISP